MDFLFLINAIFSLAIFLILLGGFIKLHKNKFLSKIIYYLSSIGILYLLIAVSSFFWFFEFLSFSKNDFLILYSLVIFLQGLLLSKVIFMISKNRKLKYFLIFFIIPFIFIFYSGNGFFNSLAIISFLLCFLFFIDLTFRSDLYDRVGYVGMLYSFFGILSYVLFFSGVSNLFLLSIFLSLLFFLLIYLLLRDLKINPPLEEKSFSLREQPYFFKILSHLVFIIVLVNLIFIGTIAVHEFGHFAIAKFSGCEAGKIVYEQGYFHTEVLCIDDSKNLFVLLGGIFFPFIIAIALFFLGGKFLKDISILIAGFNFLSLSRDLSELGISNNFILVSIFFGILFLVAGIIIIAKSKVEEDVYLSPLNRN